MKLKIIKLAEKELSASFTVLACLLPIALSACASVPEPLTLAPELCSISSGNGENYSQSINFGESNVDGDNSQSTINQTFYHAIAKPITTEYSYPVEVPRVWRSLSLSETITVEVDVDASTVWGGASAYNIDDAIEFAIENCERAGASARYVHSEMRSSGYLLPPSEFTECQLTEVSACAVNEEQVNLMSSTGELDISHQYVQISSDEMDQLANEATLSYTRKDIVESPQKYIEVEIYTDEAGRVLASFKNNAGIPLRRVEVQFLTSMGGFSSPNNTAKASVIGDIGELGIDSTIEINVSYLDFPLAMGVGVSLDQVEINLLSVELE